MELEGVRGLDRLVIERGLARGVLSPSAVAAAARRGGRLVDALVAAGAVAPAVMADLISAVKADAEQTLVPASRPAAAAVDALGDYELLEKLGEGGMGAVWRARQRSLDRLVALKLIAGDQLEPEAVQRFVREARTAARLNHPHVVRVFDAGRAADGRVFMSLELVTAGDAKQLAAAAPGERLPEARALEVVRDACRGLVALSAAGLVHRDIKPANIFIAEDGRAKLADLGLARQARGDDRITTTGLVVGTPAFMAPEQADGGEVDVRADVYALGATLFALLCGRPPFEGATGVVVLCKVLNDPAPDPRTFVPGLTPRTVRLLQRALAKAPGARFQRADELLEALDEALAVVAQPGPARRASGRAEKRRPESMRAARARPARRRGTLLAAACAAGLLALAGAVLARRANPTPGDEAPVAGAPPPVAGAPAPEPPRLLRPDARMDEPVDAPAREPVDVPPQEPADAPPQEPVDAPAQDPVDAPAQDPVAAEPAAPSPVSPTQPGVPAPTEPEPVTAPVDEPAEAPADAAAPAPARRPPRGARAAFVDVAPSVEHLLRPSDRLRALPEGWISLEGQGLTLGFREPREVEVVRFQLAVEQAQEPVLWLCLLRALDEGGRPGADVTKVDQVTGTAALGVLVSLHVTRPSTVTVCAFPADRKVPARGLEGTTTLAEGPVQLTREGRIELTCAREARGRLALSLAQGQRTVWRTTLSPRPELAGATTLHTFLGAYFELQARQRVEISPAAEPRRR